METLRRKTLQQMGKIARDYRAMLSRDYVFGDFEGQSPLEIYTDILPEEWEQFKAYCEANREEVSSKCTFI